MTQRFDSSKLVLILCILYQIGSSSFSNIGRFCTSLDTIAVDFFVPREVLLWLISHFLSKVSFWPCTLSFRPDFSPKYFQFTPSH
ncbi:hypothetical protein V1522DRAFT_417397 [Lipomyces starkeyi]